jgi:hypothetical protein
MSEETHTFNLSAPLPEEVKATFEAQFQALLLAMQGAQAMESEARNSHEAANRLMSRYIKAVRHVAEVAEKMETLANDHNVVVDVSFSKYTPFGNDSFTYFDTMAGAVLAGVWVPSSYRC